LMLPPIIIGQDREKRLPMMLPLVQSRLDLDSRAATPGRAFIRGISCPQHRWDAFLLSGDQELRTDSSAWWA
jgi:hypothetical protein